MVQDEIASMMQRPQKPGTIWQGAVVPAEALEGAGDLPEKSMVVVWMVVESGEARVVSIPEYTRERQGHFLVEGLSMAVEEAEHRPERLRVLADQDQVETVRRRLASTDMAVEEADPIRMMAEAMGSEGEESLEDLMQEMTQEGGPLAGLLEGDEPPEVPAADSPRGVTVERLRSYADAAAAFLLAQPWRNFTDDDLIHVTSPKPPHDLAYLSIMGGGGEEFGIALFQKLNHLLELYAAPAEKVGLSHDRWAITFDDARNIPDRDAALWKEHDLPLAEVDRPYPIAMLMNRNGDVHRPAAKTLAYFEAALRAVTERANNPTRDRSWVTEVQTASGPMRLEMEIIDLGEKLREQGFQVEQ